VEAAAAQPPPRLRTAAAVVAPQAVDAKDAIQQVRLGAPAEREKSERLLLNVLPRTIADRLRAVEDLALRIGVHSGPVVAGVIGHHEFIYDLRGDAVNAASRMASHGVPGAVQISAAARDRLSVAFDIEERMTIEI
jgi:class 3 adenylate cyclase